MITVHKYSTMSNVKWNQRLIHKNSIWNNLTVYPRMHLILSMMTLRDQIVFRIIHKVSKMPCPYRVVR